MEFVCVLQLPSRLFTSLFIWVSCCWWCLVRQQIINIPQGTPLFNAIVTSQQSTNYHCFTWKHTVYCRRAEERVWWPPAAWFLIGPHTNFWLSFPDGDQWKQSILPCPQVGHRSRGGPEGDPSWREDSEGARHPKIPVESPMWSAGGPLPQWSLSRHYIAHLQLTLTLESHPVTVI